MRDRGKESRQHRRRGIAPTDSHSTLQNSLNHLMPGKDKGWRLKLLRGLMPGAYKVSVLVGDSSFESWVYVERGGEGRGEGGCGRMRRPPCDRVWAWVVDMCVVLLYLASV